MFDDFKDKTIFFFTSDIATSFVANEIRVLSEKYKKVNVFTLKANENSFFEKNVHITCINFTNYSTKSIVLKYSSQLFSIVLLEFLKFPKYLLHPKTFKLELSKLLRAFYLSDIVMSNHDIKGDENIFYTFWFNDWATVLAILKKRNGIKEFYSRVHGADLFEERVPITKRLAFRWFQLKYVTKVFSVSQKGTNYLTKKYPFYANKIQTVYLGTEDKFKSSVVVNNTFTIVTCAKIRNIKRIHKVAEILMHINFPLKWIHIGSENLNDPTLPLLHENLLKLKLEKKNIEVVMLGNLTNTQVFEVYHKNYINLFVSVSETEGLPVSMMEALNFGTPILSTDVGGCDEIVTSKTGILIPANFDYKSVAELIYNEYKQTKFDQKAREVIREFWNENFNSAKNTVKFLNLISA